VVNSLNNSEIKVKLDGVRSRDDSAFEQLYHGLKTPVYTIINRIVWNQSVSEEVLQEVFLKLYCSPPDSSIRNPRAYIFKMAHNLAIDYVRRDRGDLSLSLNEAGFEIEAPADDIPLRMDIESALKSLPSQECRIVTLHVIGELKFREVAEIMGMPLGTVLWKYRKAIEKLRKLIGGSL